MQKTQLFLFLLATMLLSGCGAIETIFKAGMWWAFFLVALVIVIVVVIARKVGKK
jgi:bacteriorhodopsin